MQTTKMHVDSAIIATSMGNHDAFDEPADLEEADQRRRDLTLDIQSIQQQLGDKQRTDENGNRLSQKCYWAWRKKAQFVLNQKLDELRFIKAWLKKNRPSLNPFTHQQALDHLSSLISILDDLRDDEALEPDELTILEAAEAFLREG